MNLRRELLKEIKVLRVATRLMLRPINELRTNRPSAMLTRAEWTRLRRKLFVPANSTAIGLTTSEVKLIYDFCSSWNVIWHQPRWPEMQTPRQFLFHRKP